MPRGYIPPRFKPCRNLLDTGSCEVDNCAFQHKLIHCDPCRSFSTSQKSFTSHLNGKRHRQVLKQLHDAATQPPSSLPEPKGPRCDLCDVYAPNLARHAATARHMQKVRYQGYLNAVRDAEMSKNGIDILPKTQIDFGHLDINDMRDGKLKSLTRTIRIHSLRSAQEHTVWLMRIKTISTRSSNGQSSVISKFHPQVIEFPLAVEPLGADPLDIELTFSPRGIAGRHVDTLELYFTIIDTGESFKISRPLLATVCDKELMSQLAPVGTYEPIMWPAVPATATPDEIVEGERPPAWAKVQWKLPLLPFDVPLWVSHGLAGVEGGVKEKIRWAINARVIPANFTIDSHSSWWHGVLQLEEEQMKEDIRQYDLKNVSLTRIRGTSYFKVEVQGLAEKKPSVLYGDQVLFRQAGATKGQWYGGRVHKVEQISLWLQFDRAFTPLTNEKFDVQFQVPRLVLRRMHQAIMTKIQQPQSLFPTLERSAIASGPRAAERAELHFFNRNFDTNVPQQDAIANIVKRRHPEIPFIVFGPPGTGKTAVLVEAVLQLCENSPSRILMAAPSNAAADQLALRLIQAGLKASLFRHCAPSRDPHSLTGGLEKVICREGRDGPFCTPTLEVLMRYQVVISTCLSAGVLAGVGVPQGHFSHVFIDEAGQALEPEIMVPIKMLQTSKTQIILAGDPHQLGPIVRSPVATALGLDKSLLARFIDLEIYKVIPNRPSSTISKLTQNYRSHPSMLQFPNQEFYENALKACADPMIINSLTRWEELPNSEAPIIFHNVPGEDLREAGSPSFFNLHEVAEVKRYVVSLKEDNRFRLTDEDIGVIAPYSSQVKRIRLALKSYPSIKVGTVEEFQGQERRVILLSTVRSNEKYLEFDLKYSLGFLSNPRRMNVALTRAKSVLIVIGDASVLQRDALWKRYLSALSILGCWKGQPINWDADDYLYESSDGNESSGDETSNSCSTDCQCIRPTCAGIRISQPRRRRQVPAAMDTLFALTAMVQAVTLDETFIDDDEEYEVVDRHQERRQRNEAMVDKDWSALE